MAITGTLRASMRVTQTGANDFGEDRNTPLIQAALDLANGTGANQADIFWADQRTVATASNDDLDLAGSLTDAFGTTVAAAELVAVLIINAPRSGAANTTNLTVGAASSNPITGFMGGTSPTFGPIRPGGFLYFGCGDAGGFGAVAGGSADTLRIANSSGASATYQIAVLARTA
jgi:hypothetical protein